MLGKPEPVVIPKGALLSGTYGIIFNPLLSENLEFRTPPTEFDQIEVAMADGDNLPNTTVSLGAKVKRRALLIGVQYEADRRFTGSPSLHMLATPRDVLAVYRMLLDRGYETHNIRILVEGVVEDPLSHPKRRNIIDSLEWLFDSAEPGDYRYFHFSGHGHAYEVEGGQGKTAKIKPVVSAPVEYPNSSPLTEGEESNWSAAKSQVKFYREALLTEWSYTPWEDMLKMQTKGSLRLDAYTRISDEELNAMIAKLPKGCVLTMTLNCFHGGQMRDTHHVSTGLGYRGGVSGPAIESEEDQFITDPSKLCPNDSPRNLFVPPVFYLHSEFRFNPKIMMERVRGPNPLSGVQATVFAWSGYTTSRTHDRVFMSAFTSAVQDLKGDISRRNMFQEIRRKVSEAAEGKNDHPAIQLWTSGDGGDEDQSEVLMNAPFVI